MSDLNGILVHLLRHEVDFILVGGLAAVAQGAPVATFDVDIVHHRSQKNVARLSDALSAINARVRDLAGRHILPSEEALLGEGHTLLITDLGPLDCLGRIEKNLSYDTLKPQSQVLSFEGYALYVANLEILLELKSTWTDDESKARAALLKQTLDEQ